MGIANSITTFNSNLGFLSSATSQAIVKPQNFEGIAGFLFDIVLRDGVALESDITDHFIEDNTVINDHIALKPEIITVEGLIGELKLEQQRTIPFLGAATDKLNVFSGFLPEITTQANEVYNEIENSLETAKQVSKNIENIYSTFFDLDTSAKETFQAKAYSFFYSLWQSREVFTVDTPYNTFTNMSILSMEVNQEETTSISSFSLTFKKLRFASVLEVANNQGRRAEQLAKIEDKGRIKGEEKDQSLLRSLF